MSTTIIWICDRHADDGGAFLAAAATEARALEWLSAMHAEQVGAAQSMNAFYAKRGRGETWDIGPIERQDAGWTFGTPTDHYHIRPFGLLASTAATPLVPEETPT